MNVQHITNQIRAIYKMIVDFLENLKSDVTLFKDVREEYFKEIPFWCWIVESTIIMHSIWISICILLLSRPQVMWEEPKNFFTGLLVVIIATICFPATAFLIKYITNDRRKKTHMFYVSAKCISSRLEFVVLLTGGKVYSPMNMIAAEDIIDDEKYRRLYE